MNHDLQATSDPALIAELHVKELAEQGKAYSAQEVIEKWRAVPTRHFIVAVSCGFIAFQERAACSCYISDLYVDPRYRGQGLGRALVCAVKSGHRCVELHVDRCNVSAQALYASEGFIEIPPQKESGQPQVLMKYTAAEQGAQPDAFGAG